MVNKRFLEMAGRMKNEEIVEKKEDLENRFAPHLDFINIEKAREAKETIKKIGFVNSLAKNATNDYGIWTNGNATFGILSFLLGDKEDAQMIRDNIVEQIGYKRNGLGVKTALIKNGISDSEISAASNANFGILEYLIGNTSQAISIACQITNKIGIKKENALIKKSNNSSEVLTSANSTLGILLYLLGLQDKAEGIRERIINKIGLEGKFVKYGVDNPVLDYYSNVTFSSFSYLLGYKKEARNIKEAVTLDGGLYKNMLNEDRGFTLPYAALGVLYMTEKLKRIKDSQK